MKRLKTFGLIMVLICLSMTGCGMQTKTEYQISADILQQDVLPGGDSVRITNLEVLQRETDQDALQDQVYVQVDGEFQQLDYSRQYKLTYEYTSENGWVLQTMDPYQRENWTIQCPDLNYLKADLEAPAALGLEDFTVTDVALVDAVPNEDLTACTVSATVQGHNQYATAAFPLVASYTLTANGWEYQQSDIDHAQAEIAPFAGISENTALEDAAAQFAYTGTYAVSGTQDDFDGFQQVLYLQNHSNGNYLDMIRDLQLVYSFDPEQMCWTLESADALNTSCRLRFSAALPASDSEDDMIGAFSCDVTVDLGALKDAYVQSGLTFLDSFLD